MKIQIETEIQGSAQEVIDLNKIIRLVTACVSLEDLKEQLVKRGDLYFVSLKCGFGNNHCWVKQLDNLNNLHEDRILFITE